MKATGEVMAIDKELPGALLKAIRSLDLKIDGLKIPSLHNYSPIALREKLHNKRDDERLFAIAEALRRGWSVGDIQKITSIDPYFIKAIEKIVSMEEKLQDAGPALNGELLREAKAMGFSDREIIASLTGLPLETITRMREQEGIKPVFLKVDASSAFS